MNKEVSVMVNGLLDLDPASLTKAAVNLRSTFDLPPSAARQAMVEGRLKAIRSLGESEVRGVARVITISPQFLMRLALQGPFRKAERHFAYLASDSFNMVSKAMVKGWKKEVKKHLKSTNKKNNK